MNQPSNHPIPWHKIEYLLVDLDDTLYPQDNGLWELIRERINQYLVKELHFSENEAPAIRQRLWRQYGTTLRGLQTEYAVDMDAYLEFVHDVPIESKLNYDHELVSIFNELPQRKVIFTNASATHAQRVINILGVAEQFDAIIDIYALTPHCKPQVEAFQTVLNKIHTPPDACLLIDDSPVNLDTAQSLGMATVSVGSRVHPNSPYIPKIHNLLRLFTH